MQGLINYEHLRELQRFAELGRMSASLLHEIRTPLTAAMLNLELSDQQSAGVRRAQHNMRLLRRYVEAARQQVRPGSQPACFEIQPQIDQLKQIVIPLARKAGVRLDLRPVPNCRLRGDPVKFQHIITNLVVNAIEAYADVELAAQPPLVKLTLEHRRGWLTIRVIDRGKGIPNEALPRVFEAFYTSKGQSGHGLGIGLSIVRQYVTADFEGSVKVTSSNRQGTCFSLKLPVREF